MKEIGMVMVSLCRVLGFEGTICQGDAVGHHPCGNHRPGNSHWLHHQRKCDSTESFVNQIQMSHNIHLVESRQHEKSKELVRLMVMDTGYRSPQLLHNMHNLGTEQVKGLWGSPHRSTHWCTQLLLRSHKELLLHKYRQDFEHQFRGCN